jgi:two-component system phosphate regulon sensor histidine kinase PhoR
MNKKVFNTVILFTAFVLTGIVTLQVLWLYNLAGIRDKELFANTQQAITNTVNNLQRKENISFVTGNMDAFFKDSLMDPQMHQQVKIDMDNNGSSFIVNRTRDSIVTINIKGPENGIHVTHLSNNLLKKSERQVITETTLLRTENKIKNIDSLVQQMVFEIDAQPLRERINPDSVKALLKTELVKKGIDIHFEYAILTGDSILIQSEKYVPSSLAMTFEAKLFPDDIFDKNLKLVMYYPVSSSNGYIFSKMKFFLWLTGIFTLGILIAFYLTIRIVNRQKKLSEMKNDFINNITHEFKTPIATSSIAIAALENQQVRNDPGKFDYYTLVLKEENQKMNLQVERVLQMAMMEKGKVEVVLEDVDVHKVLENSVKGFELIFKENYVEISLHLLAEKHLVKADAFHLPHVFNNIIDNAIKYKTEECRLSIHTETRNDLLLIRFSDNGMGMNSEVQKNAFEKFYRGQKGDLHDVKGFGLGLSYAKNIIELCKGTIQLNSSPGKGTEVVISLPLL